MSLPTNYDLFIFDLDGTIVNSLPNWLNVYRSVFNEYSVNPTDEEIIDVAFYNHDRLRDLVAVDKQSFIERVLEKNKRSQNQIGLFPDAISTLQTLHSASKSIALCTTSYKSSVDQLFLLTELSKLHFDYIVTGDTLKHQKPDPEGVNRILGALNVPPSRTLYVGDSYPDLLTSQTAGIDFLWMDFPTNRPYILDSHYEVLKQQSKYRLTSYT